jgi:hypothetical protein
MHIINARTQLEALPEHVSNTRTQLDFVSNSCSLNLKPLYMTIIKLAL